MTRQIGNRTIKLLRSMGTLALFLTITIACGTPDPMMRATPTEGEVVGAGPSGRILFVSDGRVKVWDNGEVSVLTDDVNAASPTWANDWKQLAYVEMSDGYSDIVIADASGDVTQRVTENRPDAEPFSSDYACFSYWALDPVWSRDGNGIIWVSDRGGDEAYSCSPENLRYSDPLYLWYLESPDIPPYILPAAEGIGLPQENPTLSSDENFAAFVTRQEVTNTLRNTEIWILNLESGNHDVLVSYPDGAFDPAWSPVSSDVAYIQRNGTNNDVWIAPVEDDSDGIPYQITNLGDCVAPTWSPDGKFISFFRQEGSGFEAWYVNVSSDAVGKYTASAPQKLFADEDIDAPSGMSWGN